MDNPKSLVSSAHQESKASSSDALAKPSSSEIWFGDTKSEADMTDEIRNPILHTTTVNSCEVSIEPGNNDEEISNNEINVIVASNIKNEDDGTEAPTDKE